ncbi:CUB domain-containing protein [Flavobacterium sp.]|uniref:CUB domain-containing protein n=1 Tax=Flavobacterium sp. TaxID=239 RepID=UPI0025F3888F|nr:CUB domain-containing protein [Flavobacterium sp.]
MKHLSILKYLFLFGLLYTSSVAQVKQITTPNINNPFKTKIQSKTLQKKVISPAISVVDTTINPTTKIETINGSFMLDLKDLSNPIAKKVQNSKTAKGATNSIDFNTWFNLNSKHSFRLINEKVDDSIYSHQYYQQYYEGYPIEGSILMTHSNSGKLNASNGQVAEFEYIDTQINITKEFAFEKAKSSLKVDNIIKEYPIEIIVCKAQSETDRNNFKLAYKIRIDSNQPFTMSEVYIDVVDGSVLKSISLLNDIDTPATASTMYSNAQTIITDSFNGGYRLRDNGRKIETYNATNSSALTLNGFTGATDFTNSTTNWGGTLQLKSFTIASASQSWWYTPIIDELPEFYIKIKNAQGTVVYTSNYLKDTNPTITFDNLNILLVETPYTVELWEYDAVGGDDFGGNFSLSNSVGNQNWSIGGNSGSYTINTLNNPALDVHWGMEKTYDFYLNVFNRNSFDGTGASIKNYLNPPLDVIKSANNNDTAGLPNNAFAAPSPYNFMVFGLGDGIVMNPVVGLDVEGHEYSHMVIANRNPALGGLTYQGESGALNESFADIFGTCVEFYAKPTSANWNIGEDVTLPSGSFLRSMSNPKLRGQPNTYNSYNGYWKNPICGDPNPKNDKCGVHTNSGVQNYWFYLLSQGGTGTNDLGNVYSVSGIGLNKARQIAYLNLTTHLGGQNATYQDAYNGSLLAAQQLFGNPSTEYSAVRQAWYAVGIGNDPNNYCSGTTKVTTINGTISDGSGTANYGNNANCKWVIAPAGATKITLNFTAFNTQANIDKVYVYNGPDDTYPLLVTWWGNTLPPTISTSDGVGAMCVKFVSDASTTSSGWAANYTSTITTPTCSGITTLSTPTGTFDDGSGTANYTNNQQCAWYIAPPCATSVTLNFSTFNTELNYDGIVIYDSLQATNQIGVFSGTTLPASITSNTGKMLVVFVSDYGTVSQGFTANYTSTGSSYCSGVTTLNTSDYGTITDGSGANNYCNNMNCSWLIQPPQANTVTFNFKEFNLESASSDGKSIYDAVEIYDGSNDSAPLLGRFTGSSIPNAVTSTGGSMYIKFYSDNELNYSGWSGYYTSTQTPFCNGTATILTTATGTLSDGSGTDKYANNSNCAWLIQPTNAKTVTLNFTAFDTELNYDGVIIYDGSNNTAPILGKFTGTTLPPAVTSTTGSMYIEFLSDEALRSNGWSANYTSTKPSIYNLASTNFKMQVESASCIGKKTGKISATITNTNYAYQVTVTGVNSYTNTQTVPVGTSIWSITGLEKGKYSICFAIASEPTQKQCFDIEVTEPDPLSVYAKVDNSTGIINLAMLGAKNYSVNVNGKTTTVSDNNFSTVLPIGLNTISVTTDKDCQGIYQQEIFISEKAFIYPNPTFGVLHIFVGGTEENIAMNLNNLSGVTIKKMNLTVGETREVTVDLGGVPQGSYIITINSKTVSQSFKVIKL